MADDVASMDAAAMLAAARADMSPAAEVVRLWTGLPPQPKNRFGALLFLIFAFGAAAIVLAPPRNHGFSGSTITAVGVLIVLSLFVLGASLVLVASESPPDECLLLAVWYLRHSLATEDAQQIPPLEPSLTDLNLIGSVLQHPRVLWADDFAQAQRCSLFTQRLNPVLLILFLAFVATARPCVPFSASCLSVSALQGPFYAVWAVLMALSTLTRELWMCSSTALADADGIRLQIGRGRERHVGWGQVRSLTLLTFRNDSTFTPYHLYVLDAGDAVLAWGYNIIVSKGIRSQRRHNRPQDEQLAQAVAAHSKIPLRDGSALLQVVARAAKERFDPDWPKRLEVPKALSPIELSPQLEAAMNSVAPQSKFEKRDLLALVILAAYVVFCIFGWIAWS